jgi:hypothetical protein
MHLGAVVWVLPYCGRAGEMIRSFINTSPIEIAKARLTDLSRRFTQMNADLMLTIF